MRRFSLPAAFVLRSVHGLCLSSANVTSEFCLEGASHLTACKTRTGRTRILFRPTCRLTPPCLRIRWCSFDLEGAVGHYVLLDARCA